MASAGFQLWTDRLCSASGVELLRTIEAIEREFGPADTLIVPDLVEALAHPNANVRTGAAVALGSIGSGAARAAPDLLRALRDADAQVRHDAATALGRIDPSRPEIIRGLLRLL